MKIKLFSILAVVALTACGGGKKVAEQQPETEITPAQSLLATLDSVADSGHFYFGHHDDPAYGFDWHYVEGNSDVKAVTGEYPGLMSWDLGMIEVDSAKILMECRSLSWRQRWQSSRPVAESTPSAGILSIPPRVGVMGCFQGSSQRTRYQQSSLRYP